MQLLFVWQRVETQRTVSFSVGNASFFMLDEAVH